MPEEGELSTEEVLTLLRPYGTTYRKLNYWATRGYVTGFTGVGSGNHRRWAPAAVQSAKIVARIAAAGLSPEIASKLGHLGHGVWVIVTAEEERYGYDIRRGAGGVDQTGEAGADSGSGGSDQEQ